MEYLKTLFNIENKVAIVTGGSGLLGGEMAKGLLSAGAKVVLLARNEKNLQHKVETLSKINPEVMGFPCNVLDQECIQNVNKQILAKFKRIDILINAAGGHIPGAIIGVDQNVFDLNMEQFKKVTDLNLHGTVLPTLIFGKAMADQKSGAIINVSSMASQRAITRAVGYSAAKAAIENFTRWMAVEMALKFGNGIRVNAIAPGFLLTEQNRALLTNPDGSLTERGKTIINLTPFKRFGEPEELIGTVLWLASDASKFVTGTVIAIDGGFSAFSGV
ncbi:MAG: SDR family oxidoreductase [candidate division KSB1 bacterium]|nr:SDR family oxidoreductase [candidate division KSB1 bacterium]MDZ7302568.1 SDR family oxidoreductase [candidate division KSB1 bacterium]MDZ7310666.1 SDR family oxidoreductase [candidate division KSB1 bacterium]